MGILGTQTCAVCGTNVRPPHARYRIANKEIICKECYQKAQIQADQMKLGRILLSADQIKKQIRDIDKFKKMANKKSNKIRDALVKFGVSTTDIDQFPSEKIANISLTLKKHETILNALTVNDGTQMAILALTFEKIIQLTTDNVLLFPLAAITHLQTNDANQLSFEFDGRVFTFSSSNASLIREFTTQVQDRLE